MKTGVAPDSAWEVRLRWGSRRLNAEVLDGRGRTSLKLGDSPGDDIAVGSAARTELSWAEGRLSLQFSAGVEGELERRAGVSRTFSELVQTGRIVERAGVFHLVLEAGDVVTLRIGTLIAEIRGARGRFPRLPLDGRALVFIALALMAVGIMLASVMQPPEMPRLYWMKKGR